MGRVINIDPITRISGFLGIEVEVNDNRIIDAKTHGNLFRGFEKILKGRAPLDAIFITERICGICSAAHSIASSLALEDALNIVPNPNTIFIRDLIHAFDIIQNHIRHFYFFTVPDYVKIEGVSPLDRRCHSDYRLPFEINNKIASDYFRSIEFSKLAHEGLAVLGGKAPHNHGTLPGMVNIILDAYKIEELKSIVKKLIMFVDEFLLEDARIISNYYDDYYYVKPSVIIEGVKDKLNVDRIKENIKYSWYVNRNGEVIADVNKPDAYSFVKSPRYNNKAMEVGPLARMVLSGEYKGGNSTMDRIVARSLETKKILEIMNELLNRIELATEKREYNIPNFADGLGLTDTTRGALMHYVKIENKTIEDYDIITPSPWNLSPRDDNSYGIVERALIRTRVDKMDDVAEVGRIVRSFDPYVSCATH
ncbi:Periplasmic [NiFeSe] hydrogenase large subunit [Caloramator mitchellensis]|uniref:Periplasmic [NiFeSe] hydrogenase large subunit n=1 Tax=Caloramator mitchellensis TaxID=908809 RepID=A0A0R3K1K0_CALMK|nr:nickel-dependent hydrogenase large subunit [Caloramator mitchellensis]KRQ86159.1 Periplasmic [NiFeSe] hydrogenase large subunit [Caloramator mitchellensis]